MNAHSAPNAEPAVHAQVAAGYQVRYKVGASNYSATFDVVAVSVGLFGFRHPSWAEDARAYDSAPVGGFGPSAADGVDLATGVYSNDPGADLGCRNPLGPDAVYERSYRSDLALEGYGSPGLSPGWVDNYDVRIDPVGSGGGWGNLLLRHTNGAQEILSPVLNATGAPTGQFGVTTGAPYFVRGVASTTAGRWKSLKITSADESSVTFTPDPLDPTRYVLSQITNVVGRSIYIVRDPKAGDRITAITDDGVRPNTLLVFFYDGSGHLANVREAYGRRVDYTFGLAAGATCLLNVSQTRTASSRQLTYWTYTYTLLQGQPVLSGVAVPNPSGAAGSIGHPISYDSKARVTALTDANGRRRTYNYGSGSTQIAVLDEKGAVTLAWTQKLSARSTDAGTVDALGAANTAAYNDPSNPDLPTHVMNENGQMVQAQYDPHGNVLVTTDLRGVQTHYAYDYSVFPLGRLVSVQQGAKTPTKFGYYPNGLLAFVDSPRPGTVGANQWVRTSYTYTALGNVETVTVPAPASSGTVTVRYGYTSDPQYGYFKSEALGEPVTVTDPLGNTTHFQYDARGNVTTVIDAEGNRSDYIYDDADRVVTALAPPTGQNGAGRATTLYKYLSLDGPLYSVELFDESGKLIRSGGGTLGSEGEVVKTQSAGIPKELTAVYDGAYRPTSVDRSGNTVSQKFDAVGNLTFLRSPRSAGDVPPTKDKRFTRYDAAGNLLQMIDSYNLPVKVTRAADDSRVLSVYFGDGLYDKRLNTTYTYDQYGRVVMVSNPVSTLSYAYDDNDLVTSVTTSYVCLAFPMTPVPMSAKTINFVYNADGSRASMGTPAGTFSYTYDSAGRMTSATFPWTGGYVSYTYFRNGWIKSQQDSKVTTTYTYSARGNLLSLTNKDGSGTMLSAFTGMLYNGAGQRTYMALNVPDVTGTLNVPGESGTVSYEYDIEGRLTRESGASSRSYGNYDYQFAWNADGSPSKLRNVAYAGFGTDADGNGLLGVNLEHPYDRLGHRRASTATYLTFWIGDYRPDGLRAYRWEAPDYGYYTARKRFYLYDGTHVLCELDENGAPAVSYGYGANGLVQTRTYGTGAATSTFTFDPQGSAIQSIDATQPHQYKRYDAFGNPLWVTSYSELNSIDSVGYSAQWGGYTDFSNYGVDNAGDSVVMGYRIYRTDRAQFLTPDPIGYAGGYNLYAYCDGDPVNHVDPDGLDSSWWDQAKNAVHGFGHAFASGVIDFQCFSPVSHAFQLFGQEAPWDAKAREVLGPAPKGEAANAGAATAEAFMEILPSLFPEPLPRKNPGPKASNNTKLNKEVPETKELAKGGTYLLKENGIVKRTGRTNDLARRKAEHLRHPDTEHLQFEIDRRSDSHIARRGREAIIHKDHAASATLNKIRALDPKHPRFNEIMEAGRSLK